MILKGNGYLREKKQYFDEIIKRYVSSRTILHELYEVLRWHLFLAYINRPVEIPAKASFQQLTRHSRVLNS